MRFYGTTACVSFLGLLATAAIVSAQINVTSPPPGTVGPTNVRVGPVDVQTTPGGGTSVNLGAGVPGPTANQIRNDEAVRQDNRIERREERLEDRNAAINNNWRMRNYSNQWWYWNPNNSWSVYRNNQWVPHTANGAAIVVPNAAVVPNTATSQPATQYYYSRRGAIGVRRQVTGYRGPISTSPPATMPTNTPAPTSSMSINPTAPAPVPANPTTDTGAARPEGGTNGQPNDPLIKGVK